MMPAYFNVSTFYGTNYVCKIYFFTLYSQNMHRVLLSQHQLCCRNCVHEGVSRLGARARGYTSQMDTCDGTNRKKVMFQASVSHLNPFTLFK